MNGAPCEQGPLYQAPWPMLVLMPAAVAIGIAEGALDALLQLAKSGRRQFRAATAMQDSDVFRYELGRAAAEIRTARLALEAQAKSHWAHACAGTLRNEACLIEGQQIAIHAAEACRRASESCSCWPAPARSISTQHCSDDCGISWCSGSMPWFSSGNMQAWAPICSATARPSQHRRRRAHQSPATRRRAGSERSEVLKSCLPARPGPAAPCRRPSWSGVRRG